MRQALDWFFRDRRSGAITVAQAPNLVLWIVIGAAGLRWLVPSPSRLDTGLGLVVRGGLILWAVDEILRGVNPWRRCLGATVLALVTAPLITKALSSRMDLSER